MLPSIFNDWIILFHPYVGPKRVLLLPVRMKQGVIAMKECYTFLKAPRLEGHISEGVLSYPGTHVNRVEVTELQSAYPTAPVDRKGW